MWLTGAPALPICGIPATLRIARPTVKCSRAYGQPRIRFATGSGLQLVGQVPSVGSATYD